MDIASIWTTTPRAWKAALAIALFFQVCSLSSSNRITVNGVVTDCRYLDYGKLVAALVVVALLVLGWLAHREENPRLPTGLAVGLVTVTALLAVVLVLRGLGLLMDPCDDIMEGAQRLLGR